MQAKKQHKGFEKLLALGGLWEIVKGKGKAITPAPFWVWEGLATHTPAAAELAAQAADVASAARYFEVSPSQRGSHFPCHECCFLAMHIALLPILRHKHCIMECIVAPLKYQ